MKISSLLRVREVLNIPDETDIISQAAGLATAIEAHVDHPDYEIKRDIVGLMGQVYRNLESNAQEAKRIRCSLIKSIDREISILDQEYYRQSQEVYDKQNKDFGVEDTRRLRKLKIYESTRDLIRSRVGIYVDWRYPGLEIGPGDGEWTEHLVACDPLYLADIHQEFLDSTKSRFNEVYQRRLRCYLIKDFDLSPLPQGQFGFVFCWNVFNYFPISKIRDCLSEIFKVVRPGGTLMFSYNNGHFWESAMQVENCLMSHVVKEDLVQIIEDIGYEIAASYDETPGISWFEVSRPGEKKTIKAHPVIGQIINVKK